MSANPSDYTLVVCEKPDAGRKVAEALADGRIDSRTVNGVEVLAFRRGDKDYLVCSAIGHLYGVSDSFQFRETYPVFDLEWYPANLVDKRAAGVRKRILSIGRLAKDASSFVNACDYDAEGETIGYNVLRYACGGKEDVALRARFSTLTKEDLVSSFAEARAGTGMGLARAGRTRHALDFIWGVNLSRVLSSAANASASSGYRIISMGRVQGPALAFIVEKEVEIRSFVPVPYWTVRGVFEKDGTRFEAPSSKAKFLKKSDAESVKLACEGKNGVVSEVTKSIFREPPPPPFNTGDLQKEAYRLFGFSPTKTLQIAERLYLDALISYPRTSSQKLPNSIGYREILSRLAAIGEYADLTKDLLEGRLSPREGEQVDRAHPAIYPTGLRPRRPLPANEGKIFDVVVRRFLACFGEDAVRERANLRIAVDGNEFAITGRRTLKLGWMKYSGRYARADDRVVPGLVKGDVVTVVGIDCDEKLESPPSRYNQSSILEKMEREGIGTKATRADTIAVLMTRGYVTGDLEATDLGISLVETMQEYCPKIVSVDLTREIERQLEDIENGTGTSAEVMERAIAVISQQLELLKSNEAAVGRDIGGAAVTRSSSAIIGICPVCKTGNLIIIRSRKTGKRFIGCTNYSTGCRASGPLPQRGPVKAAGKPCSRCGWPAVYVRFGRFPRKLCVNTACRGKVGSKNVVQALQKTS